MVNEIVFILNYIIFNIYRVKDINKLRSEILKKSANIREVLSDLNIFFKKYATVLIVDHSEITNFFNKKLIESLNICSKVKSITDGEKGLEFLKKIKNKHFPLLILIDINLPVIDGFEFVELAIFCNFITENGITIVFITDIQSDTDIEILKSKGLINYPIIEKPLTKDKLKILFQ